MDIGYSKAGRIEYKNLVSDAMKNGNMINTAYADNYEYKHPTNPYAVTSTGSNYFCWDNAGNMTGIKEQDIELMYWTEDNRMQSYGNISTGQSALYRYDASGERELKLLGNLTDINIMGNWYKFPVYDNAVLYSGPLLTVNKSGYIKHYFMESERFLSSIGGGTAGAAITDPFEKIAPIANPNDPTQASAAVTADDLSELYSKFVEDYFVEHNNKCCDQINYQANLNIPPLSDIFDKVASQRTADITFYWHPDYLGSGTAVTDKGGNTQQIMAEIAYGEPIFEMSNGNFETDFRFGGYIFDQESQLLDAGQRYYAGRKRWPQFISTDPMWYKTPNLTPYHYCSLSPLMRTDPTGMLDGDYYKDGVWIGNDGKNDNKIYENAPPPSNNLSGNLLNYTGGTTNSNSSSVQVPLQGQWNHVGNVTGVRLSYEGQTNENRPNFAEGQLNVIQMGSNGKEYNRMSINAVSGYGSSLFSLQNGNYESTNPHLTAGKGYVVDNFGFAIDLKPLFPTQRTDLQIHPDEPPPGTAGCIGLQVPKEQLMSFYKNYVSYYNKFGNINVNVNIRGNLNCSNRLKCR